MNDGAIRLEKLLKACERLAAYAESAGSLGQGGSMKYPREDVMKRLQPARDAWKAAQSVASKSVRDTLGSLLLGFAVQPIRRIGGIWGRAVLTEHCYVSERNLGLLRRGLRLLSIEIDEMKCTKRRGRPPKVDMDPTLLKIIESGDAVRLSMSGIIKKYSLKQVTPDAMRKRIHRAKAKISSGQ